MDFTEADQQAYRDHVAQEDTRATDDKGRVRANLLTDRELAVESVILLRAFGDALEALGQNPMLKAMMPKFGK